MDTSFWKLPAEEQERLRAEADRAEAEVEAHDNRCIAQQEARED